MIADGRVALRETDGPFDMILGDTYDDLFIPPHLVTREFFELARNRLGKDGIIIMNVVDAAETNLLTQSIAATMRAVFPMVEFWHRNGDVDFKSFLLVGAKEGNACALKKSITLGKVVWFCNDARDPEIVGTDAIVLTDNFAPVDRLISFEPQQRGKAPSVTADPL